MADSDDSGEESEVPDRFVCDDCQMEVVQRPPENAKERAIAEKKMDNHGERCAASDDVTLYDISIEDLHDDSLEAIIGGISLFQMEALRNQASRDVDAAGHAMLDLAEQNPEAVRDVLLNSRGAFRVERMPESLLDTLGLTVVNGEFEEAEDWEEVEVK